MSHRWQPARACTVIGAAHRRRGGPCQDASLAVRLEAPGGEVLELMAVADGHGGSRYWLSAVGSALACRQAEVAVGDLLLHTSLQDGQRWEALLQEDLPERITAGWLAAIAADWRQRPEAEEQPFSPLTYGSTLGLVLMAPGWWGTTGLGDWDLVKIHADGSAQLVSEEPPQPGQGEATASLCQEGAAALWAGRAQLQRLEPAPSPVVLMLSTDGLRKSCATDADFLRLCSQVVAVEPEEELRSGLEQVSLQGSGDDLSLAIGRWGECGAASPGPPRRRAPWRRRSAALVAGGLSLAAIAGWGLARLAGRAPTRPEPALQGLGAEEVRRLCRQPALITPSLNQRRPQFRQLLERPGRATAMLAASQRDPLGGVIAASQRGSLVACAPLQLQLQEQWRRARAEAGKMTPLPSTPLPSTPLPSTPPFAPPSPPPPR